MGAKNFEKWSKRVDNHLARMCRTDDIDFFNANCYALFMKKLSPQKAALEVIYHHGFSLTN